MTTIRRNFSRRRTRPARPVRHVHRAGCTPRCGLPAPVPQRGLRGAHTGLVYMKNRWYSPTLGHFLNRIRDAPPGNMVLWRGMARLTDIHLGFSLAKDVGN